MRLVGLRAKYFPPHEPIYGILSSAPAERSGDGALAQELGPRKQFARKNLWAILVLRSGWRKNQLELLMSIGHRLTIRRLRSLFPLLLAVCLGAPFASLAAYAGEQRSPIDGRAEELLKRMSDYLAKAKSFSVNAEIWQDIELSSGQQIQAGRNLQLQVRRPNRLHAEVRSP